MDIFQCAALRFQAWWLGLQKLSTWLVIRKQHAASRSLTGSWVSLELHAALSSKPHGLTFVKLSHLAYHMGAVCCFRFACGPASELGVGYYSGFQSMCLGQATQHGTQELHAASSSLGSGIQATGLAFESRAAWLSVDGVACIWEGVVTSPAPL